MKNRRPNVYFYLLSLTLSLALILTHFLQDYYSSILFLIKAATLQVSISLMISNFCLAALLNKKYIISAILINGLLVSTLFNHYSSNSNNVSQNSAFTITSFSSLTRTRNGQDLNDFLQTSHPDILCLQEVTNEDTYSLNKHYKYVLQPSNDNLVIASHWPIKNIDTRHGIQYTTIAINNIETPVINVHMSRQYRTIGIDNIWLDLLNKVSQKERIIMCGDFNMTPYNSMYTKIVQQLKFIDSHDQGKGFGFTFPHKQRKISLLGSQVRIDYIFTKGFQVISSKSFGLSDLSDHKAVEATIQEY